MFKNGFKAIIDPGGASYLTHYSVEESTPLYMHGNSFYLRLLAVKTVPTTTKVVTGIGEAEDWEHPEGKSEDETEEVPEAGITDRQIESKMSLTPQSRIVDMRNRLKQLGYVIHGSKEEVWKRLKRAEKEEFRRLEKERLKNAEIQMRNEDLVQSGAQVKAPDEPTPEESLYTTPLDEFPPHGGAASRGACAVELLWAKVARFFWLCAGWGREARATVEGGSLSILPLMARSPCIFVGFSCFGGKPSNNSSDWRFFCFFRLVPAPLPREDSC